MSAFLERFSTRALQDSDRPFLRWMDELTETWGDETAPLSDTYRNTRERYVENWLPEEGGALLFTTTQHLSPTDPLFTALSTDIGRADPFDPGFDRTHAFGAAARHARGLLEIPIGAAWLRLFKSDAPGYAYIADDIPEMAVAIRPAAVSKGLSQILLRGALAEARRIGCRGVCLSVEDGNDRAKKAYLRAGFEVVGRATIPEHDALVCWL
ncbi:GNAT family N-acetyltransferase [Corynebacterium poyangense]|uniref:GNAT family N-acetyltransferase n=1 Tax=Corynebacterium poyangense TaxID=2684405 RepID=A0A7H0SLF7_9CORY|nr:GNAT family N-acetyltransferase [Corynebacterium poyangense]MBZ8177475.1 GNAT family N-acetyltransferase [Corynebacterium poyangense]QNQ89382.1 GNAT family N-acetyltransferase [Corynebacterium poyangense]